MDSKATIHNENPDDGVWTFGDLHCLVVEEPNPSYYENNGCPSEVGKKVSEDCWMHMKCIHYIPTTELQLYIARRLDTSHYQISREEYSAWYRKVKVFIKKMK